MLEHRGWSGLKQPLDRAHQLLRRGRLLYDDPGPAGLMHMRVAGVQNERHTALIESLTKRAAFTIAQPEVQDGRRQVGMGGEPHPVAQIVCRVHEGPGRLEDLDNVECNERFVFDDQDRVPCERHFIVPALR